MAELSRAASVTSADIESLRRDMMGRFDGIERRLDGHDHRLDGHDERFDRLEAEMRSMEGRLTERIDLKTESVEHRVMGALHELRGDISMQFVTMTRVFVFALVGALATVATLAFTAARMA